MDTARKEDRLEASECSSRLLAWGASANHLVEPEDRQA